MNKKAVPRGSKLTIVVRLVLALIAASVWLMPNEFPWWVLLTSTLIAIEFVVAAVRKYRDLAVAGDRYGEPDS